MLSPDDKARVRRVYTSAEVSTIVRRRVAEVRAQHDTAVADDIEEDVGDAAEHVLDEPPTDPAPALRPSLGATTRRRIRLY
jgi:hypothetical protein